MVDAAGHLRVPADYRTLYQALGSWAIAADSGQGSKEVHAVYASPGAIDAYRKTGHFPDGAVLVKEVFAHYGLAAYLAHVLERSLVNALTTVYGPGPTRLTPTELERRFEDLSKKGLGALAQVLAEAGLSEPVVATAKRWLLSWRANECEMTHGPQHRGV